MPGTNLAHEARCPGVGNRVMSIPIGDDERGCGRADAGDLIDPVDRVIERARYFSISWSVPALTA